jgi:transcriptional regulator with XRE-family HTH domain
MAYVIIAGFGAVAITQEERKFFVRLGSRIAALRKQAQITQVQLAKTLGVAQSTLNAYELGQRRVPVSALPVLATALAVSVEELIGERVPAARKSGPAPKLQQHIERISQLPKAKQRFVMQMLDAVLAQASRSRRTRSRG